MATQTLNTWVVFYPAPDVEGIWVAHCLDFDLVNQGRTLNEAWDAICVSLSEAMTSALELGKSPYEVYKRAPDEDIHRFLRLHAVGKVSAPTFEAAAREEVIASSVCVVIDQDPSRPSRVDIGVLPVQYRASVEALRAAG